MAEHGGNIWTHEDVLDFSASLNPLGMAPQVREAALRGLEASVHYPDPSCAAPTAALCKQWRVPAAWTLWGSGAASLLERIAALLRPKRALLFEPCFGEYRRVLERSGCTIECCPLLPEENFDLGERHIASLTDELDMVILCNPNNPTGRCVPSYVLIKILERCTELGVFLLLDESFLTLTDVHRRTDLLPLLSTHPGVLLLRSLTKDHCIPGLRAGYALCSDEVLVERLRSWAQPWELSVPAQFAAAAAVECPDWPEKALKVIAPQRERLKTALEDLGCRVWESHTNFLLFRREGDASLRERLLKRGILIRSCKSFPGLREDYYRIAVGTQAMNTALLAAMGEEC